MVKKLRYHLFDVAGVELEYMIVNRDNLKIMPVADELFFKKTGTYSSDYYNGKIDWSNELVNHLIELKTHSPEPFLNGIDQLFTGSISEINSLLAEMNAMLLPTASHPFMEPVKETVIWPHEYNEIYSVYDRIFDCRAHGWANLQCVHLNLPFIGDKEFSKLHTAIRILLPLIPALAASSPLREGKLTGWLDSRMESYLNHQRKMPSLMGYLIPEAVFSEEEYYDRIFDPIIKDIAPYDHKKIMEHHFLNSRGAIARFDRGAIEIRVTDIQECPASDIAISSVIIGALKEIVSEKWAKVKDQGSIDEKELLLIFKSVIKDGRNTIIENPYYLRLFGISKKITAGEIWWNIFLQVEGRIEKKNKEIVELILTKGSLAERIIRKINGNISSETIVNIYKELSKCLVENRIFI